MARVFLVILSIVFVAEGGVAGGSTCPARAKQWGYGPAAQLAALGGELVALQGKALTIFDVTDPASPRRLSEVMLSDLLGCPGRMVAAGDFVYVLTAQATLEIIDASNRLEPVRAASVALPARGMAIAVSGGYAYVAADRLVMVVDVGDPASARVITSFEHRATRLVAEGSLLYSIFATELGVMDVSDPRQPSLVTTIEVEHRLTALSIGAGFLYATDTHNVSLGGSFGSLLRFGLRDPANPVLLDQQYAGMEPDDIVVENGLLLVWEEDDVAVFRVSEEGAPFLSDWIAADAWILDAAIVLGRMCVASGLPGVRIVDVDEPGAPAAVGFIATYHPGAGVAMIGDLVLNAAWSGGLRLFALEESGSPRLLSVVRTAGDAYAVEGVGTTAHVLDERFEEPDWEYQTLLSTIDVTDPARPTLEGSIVTPGVAMDLAASEGLVVVVDSLAGLLIYDATDPEAVVEVARHTIPDAQYQRVELDGNMAYLSASGGGTTLVVLDLNIPAQPRVAAVFDAEWQARAIAVDGDLLLAVSESPVLSLHVLKIEDPARLHETGSLELDRSKGFKCRLAADGGLAVVDCLGTANVVDLSSPGTPVLGASIPEVNSHGLVLSGTRMITSNSCTGLQVIDLGPCLALPLPVIFENHLETSYASRRSATVKR